MFANSKDYAGNIEHFSRSRRLPILDESEWRSPVGSATIVRIDWQRERLCLRPAADYSRSLKTTRFTSLEDLPMPTSDSSLNNLCAVDASINAPQYRYTAQGRVSLQFVAILAPAFVAEVLEALAGLCANSPGFFRNCQDSARKARMKVGCAGYVCKWNPAAA